MISYKINFFLLLLYFHLKICYSVKVIHNNLLEVKKFYTHPIKNNVKLKQVIKPSPLNIASTFIRDELRFNNYKLLSNYKSGGDIAHLAFQQMVEGREVFNGFININIEIYSGNILSYGSSFAQLNKTHIANLTNFKSKLDKQKIKQGLSKIMKFNRLELSELELEHIILTLQVDADEFTYSDRIAKCILELKVNRKGGWYQLNSGKLRFVFEFNIRMINGEYFSSKLAFGEPFEIIEKIDLVNNLIPNYMVQSLYQNTNYHYHRSLTSAPFNNLASPFGWHTDLMRTYLQTEGNNVRVGLGDEIKSSYLDHNPHIEYTRSDDQFIFSHEHESVYDAIVNVFYVTNMVHDILLYYGFDEQAGNFQTLNKNPKLGKGGDPIIEIVWPDVNPIGPRFQYTIDGVSPVMYLPAKLNKDGTIRYSGLDNSVIIHELGHGLSERLTGGPVAPNCLHSFESAGMGEGWSDALAYIIQTKATSKRSDMTTTGSYFYNRSKGSRVYPYTSDQTKNRHRYSKLKEIPEMHLAGEVWASILHEVYWNLIDHLGFSSNLMKRSKPHDQIKGNVLMLKLMIMGMKLQPCRPTFIEARDAFIQAERQITKGDYQCLIWDGFAKRGLGFTANKDGIYNDSFDLPPACLNKKNN